MALSEGRRGEYLIGKGSVHEARLDYSSAVVSTDGHGRYQEAVLNGNVYMAANPGTQALSVNSATATGLVLTNPAGSNKYLVLLRVSVSIASLPAGQSSLIITGSNNPIGTAVTHTTPLTVRNALYGSSALGSGLADSAATIPTPAVIRVLGGGPAATVATSTAFPPFIDADIAGEIILVPGVVISLQALTTAMTVVASMTWEEVPI